MNRRVWAGVVAASLCFGLFTTYEHVIARGMAYFAEGADQYANGRRSAWPITSRSRSSRCASRKKFAVLGIAPFAALAGRRRWPAELSVLAWALVPVWFVIHAFVSVVA